MNQAENQFTEREKAKYLLNYGSLRSLIRLSVDRQVCALAWVKLKKRTAIKMSCKTILALLF